MREVVGIAYLERISESFWRPVDEAAGFLQFALLEVLAKKAPRLVRYEEIAAKIWDKDNYKVRNRIKYLIYLLRQKIEIDPNDPQLVINREGLGYQLDTREKTEPVV